MTNPTSPSLRLLALLLAAVLPRLAAAQATETAEAPERPNILLIVADDMNWDSVGVYGSPIKDLTPHIDQLASDGLRFEHAHVIVSACWPSRHALLTGRYPHRSGGEGFAPLRISGVPTLPALLKDSGYRVGVIGKAKHSTPHEDFEWDMRIDTLESGRGRSPKLLAESLERIIEESRAAEQPFFLMANSHDPHRPFHGQDDPTRYESEEFPTVRPSRRLTKEEISVPPFLPDLPMVRKDLAAYFESVGRLDEGVGALLAVLAAEELEDDTLVVFLSDNGMSFPFVKANCYRHSTRTPLIVRWPGHVESDVMRSEEMISGVDLMPTLLGVAGVGIPDGVDGDSFWPLVEGESQPDRQYAFTQYYGTIHGDVVPMRSVQGRRYGYNFNPWSDGKAEYLKVEYTSSPTMQAMGRAAMSDIELDVRIYTLVKRTPEEFFDYERDPHGLRNLIHDAEYADEIAAMRKRLETWMVRFEDPALEAFRKRESPEARRAYVEACARIMSGGE